MDSLSRREFVKKIGITTASVGTFSIMSPVVKALDPPNIILILADDLGYETIGCNGGTSYETPFLNELARTGVRFNHCYSTPLCTPSRVQIMTGKYNFRNYTEFGNLKPGEVTFGHLLQAAGYITCVAGKWQLAGHYKGSNYKGMGTYPGDAGFDEYCLWQIDSLGSRYWNPVINRNGRVIKNLKDKYGPDIFCEYINEFIKRNRKNPFFVYYPMVLTHAPFVPVPDIETQAEERNKGNKRNFAGMVTYMDKIVRRIVKNLDELGLRENTIIIFTGDNGTPRGIESRMGKNSVTGGKGETTDAGTHVPLIINWKGTAPMGAVSDNLIDFTDFLPTLLESANIQMPGGFFTDGRSFFPQILGNQGNPRKWIFCHYDPKWSKWTLKRFVRDKRWKLYHDGRLFDIGIDPLEENPITPGQMNGETYEVKKRFQVILNKMK